MRDVMGKLLLAAALLLAAGCGYPKVKPAAFNPKPRVAIVSFRADAVQGGLMGVPMPMKSVNEPYTIFSKGLASVAELTSVDDIQKCERYSSLPGPFFDIGTTASRLRRIATPRDTAGFAECVGADIVVLVTAETPVVEKEMGVMGVNSVHVKMTVMVQSYDNEGKEVWFDRFDTQSPSFIAAGSLMDPNEVDKAALTAFKQGAGLAVKRFKAKLKEEGSKTTEAAQ